MHRQQQRIGPVRGQLRQRRLALGRAAAALVAGAADPAALAAGRAWFETALAALPIPRR